MADKPTVAEFLKPRMRGKKAATVLPWVEKFRPKTIDEVAHQPEVVQTLKTSLQSGNLPHLLFYGPPGTGKTSTILAIARDLFGHDYYRTRVLELNASDERGIAVIRDKVKTFAQAAASEIPVKGGQTIPPYKLIILDEADSLTQDAQAALRRTMETYSRVTRFCIICNYISRIIEPVASRCAKFRFRSLEPEVMLARLRYIADQEEVQVEDAHLMELAKLSDGDLRRAITLLQSVTRLHGKTQISRNAIIDVAAIIDPTVCESLMAACRAGSFDLLQAAVTQVTASGYSASQVFAQLNDIIIHAEDIADKDKATIGWAIAEADKALVDGADEFLQILRVFSVIMTALQVPLT